MACKIKEEYNDIKTAITKYMRDNKEFSATNGSESAMEVLELCLRMMTASSQGITAVTDYYLMHTQH